MSLFKEDLKVTPTVKTLPRCMPQIVINKTALIKMQLYVEGCTDEIGWLGTATKKDNVISIEDVFLFGQDVHGTTTEITPEGLSSFAEEILQVEGGMDIWNNLKVWGHSHVNMGVSPSGQDDKQMETFAEGGHNWFIRIIGNKKGDIRVDLYDYEAGIIYNTMKWEEGVTNEEYEVMQKIQRLQELLAKVDDAIIATLRNPITEEIKEKVKKKVYQQTYTGYRGGIWDNQQVTTNYPSKTTTNTGVTYSTTAGHEKKTERTAKERRLYLITEAEIRNEIDMDTLIAIGEASTLKEVKDELFAGGYGNSYYDQQDTAEIWKYGMKYVASIYSGIDIE